MILCGGAKTRDKGQGTRDKAQGTRPRTIWATQAKKWN